MDTKPGLLSSFDDLREQNFIALREAKEKGVKVVGIYCTYGPRELVLAAGGIPVGLCGTKQEPIAVAERDLPRNLCPMVKSSYGFAAGDTCPYFHLADLVIGETTCDGKKHLETDYSASDVENLRVRIQAFLEMCVDRRRTIACLTTDEKD